MSGPKFIESCCWRRRSRCSSPTGKGTITRTFLSAIRPFPHLEKVNLRYEQGYAPASPSATKSIASPPNLSGLSVRNPSAAFRASPRSNYFGEVGLPADQVAAPHGIVGDGFRLQAFVPATGLVLSKRALGTYNFCGTPWIGSAAGCPLFAAGGVTYATLLDAARSTVSTPASACSRSPMISSIWFDTDGQPDITGRDACLVLLFRRQLRMRGRRGMDRERPRVTDIGHVIEHFEVIDELLSRFASAAKLEAKPKIRSRRSSTCRPYVCHRRSADWDE